MKIKRLIFAAVIIISLFFILVVFRYKYIQREIKQIAIHKQEIYGDIEFSGKVDSIIEIRRGGRTYGLMCIDLDYSSVDSFYKYDKYTTLKIKNNKAIIPTGPLGDINNDTVNYKIKSKYIQFNIDNNRKIVYSIHNENDIVVDWCLRNNNLKEEDMSKCGF